MGLDRVVDEAVEDGIFERASRIWHRIPRVLVDRVRVLVEGPFSTGWEVTDVLVYSCIRVRCE